jgi:hypothetical protein
VTGISIFMDWPFPATGPAGPLAYPPTHVDEAGRRQLIERYKEGACLVREALQRMTDAELDERPGPAEWTAREIAHHLPDSEMTSAIRLRRLLAEDHPMIEGYDENEFARRLRYQERPIEDALDALEAIRRVTAEVPDRMTDGEWARQGAHSPVATAARRGSRSTPPTRMITQSRPTRTRGLGRAPTKRTWTTRDPRAGCKILPSAPPASPRRLGPGDLTRGHAAAIRMLPLLWMTCNANIHPLQRRIGA